MSESNARQGWIKAVRVATQLFFLGLFAFFAIHHQYAKGGPTGSPPLDVYCPFGGIEGLYRYAVMGELIPRIQTSNFVILVGVLVMTLLVKSAFCSWVCPLGSVQEWLGKLGRALFGRSFSPPARIDGALRYLKYVVLIVVFVGSAWAGSLVFRAYDPFIALFHLGWGHVVWTAYLVLIATLIAGVFVFRPWCRYLCPFGAVLAPLGKLSLIKPVRDADACEMCKRCDKACQMGIAVSEGTRVSSAECHACLDCIAADPHPGSLTLQTKAGQRMPLIVVPIVVFVCIFGFVYGGKAAGLYSSTKGGCHSCSHHDACESSEAETPGRRRARGSAVEVEGQAVKIRGGMSLVDVERETGVPTSHLIRELGLPPSTSRDVNLGRLKREYGFDMPRVREIVRKHLAEAKPAGESGAKKP